MPNMLFTNNAATTLASSINNSVTSLTVATGTGALFPTLGAGQYFFCTLANTAGTVEIIKVTARSGDTFSTIIRGQDNTSAVSWNSGDKVELRLVNADLTNFPQLDSDNTFAGTQTFSNTITGSISGNAGTATTAADLSATLAVNKGGTGQTTYTNGQLLIGNTTGNTLTKATLTAGTGISVTNGTGSITIASTVTSGQLQSELFTAPGTWTKPASVTSVRVTVIGGGGGSSYFPTTPGSPGGTSSFGPAVSATGGTGASGSPVGSPGTPGTGTVSVGTSLRTGGILRSLASDPLFISLNNIFGSSPRSTATGAGPKSSIAYSTSSLEIAGAGGGGANGPNGPPNPGYPGGAGGYAVAIVPVSAPVSVTIGSGGAASLPPTVAGTGGVNGAVLVEFIG